MQMEGTSPGPLVKSWRRSEPSSMLSLLESKALPSSWKMRALLGKFQGCRAQDWQSRTREHMSSVNHLKRSQCSPSRRCCPYLSCQQRCQSNGRHDDSQPPDPPPTQSHRYAHGNNKKQDLQESNSKLSVLPQHLYWDFPSHSLFLVATSAEKEAMTGTSARLAWSGPPYAT